MFNFFKKNKNVTADRQHSLFSRMEQNAKTHFVSFLSSQEKKFTAGQKKTIFFLFCCVIVSIHLMSLYRATRPSGNHQRPAHQNITIPRDIALPDSLDIPMIRRYREMKRQQDSLEKK